MQGYFTSSRECIRIVKPVHRKQYVNLEKEPLGQEDECGLRLPAENSELTCVVVEIDPQVVARTMAVEIWTQDPPYEPPEGDTEPTNPGVANDFGNKRREGSDNRGFGGGTPCPPGRQCFACRAAPPHRQVTCKRIGVWRDGDRFISAVQLNTGAYGGDNFTVHAVRIPSPSAENWASCTAVHTRGPLTAWRRYDVYRDEMTPDLRPDTSLVRGVLDDSFVEIRIIVGVDTMAADYLRWKAGLGYDHCWMGVPQGETYPHGLGAGKYTHLAPQLQPRYDPFQGDHPPSPEHSFQSQGVAYLAENRCTVEGREDKFDNKVYGIWCPWPTMAPYTDPDHSFVAVENIRLANSTESLCNVEEKDRHAGDRLLSDVCTALGIRERDCIDETTLLTRTTAHELLHALSARGDDWGTPCTFTETSGLLLYRCLFDNRFGGWASRDDILAIRSQPTKE